jgi:hypothetical protein
MKRYLRGMVLLGVSATLWACNTESTAVESGGPVKIIADPQTMFVDQGETKTALIRLVDQQGGALTAPFTISNVGAGITVAADSGFRPIYNADGELVYNSFNNELRLLITGNALTATSFDVEAEGFTQTVDVTVMPTSIEATVAGSPADATVPMTITAPAGLTFGTDAQILDAAGTNVVAYITAYSADSTSITVIPIPGAAGTDITISDVHPAYAPALSLTLPSTADLELTGAIGAGFPGATAIATAPEIRVAVGGGIVDIGTDMSGDVTGTGADGGRFYKIVVAEDGEYDVTLSWDSGKDLGVVIYDGAGTPLAYIADAHGTGGSASPETAEALELTAGTYYLAVVWFDYAASFVLPDFFTLTVSPTE